MKVSAGESVKGKLSARFFNRTDEANEWYHRNKARGEGGAPLATPSNNATVMVKNDSGANVRRGEVLEFTGFLLADLDPRYLWFSGATPDLSQVGWGILLDPAELGVIRECLISGACLAFVNILDESHQYAERFAGSRVLQSASTGPVKVLHKPTGGATPDERECVVQIMDEIGGAGLIRFELDATLALKGHAEAKLLDEEWAELDPPVAIEVFDPYQVGAGMWAGVAGYQGFAVPRPEPYLDEGEEGSEDDEVRLAYDILWMEQTAAVIQFTTTEYMAESTPGGLNVTISWFDHQGRELVGTVTIYHINSQFPDVHSGAKGTAVYDYKSSFYRIVSSQRVAKFATATISESLCPDADPAPTTVAISGFAVLPCGDYIGSPPTTPTVANIGTIHAGMNGDKVKLRRIDNAMPNPTWEIIAIDKHLLEPVVNVELTATELKQWKRKVWVEACDATETDSPIDTLSTCEEE